MSELCRVLVHVGCCYNACSLFLFIYFDVQFYDGINCENNNVGVQEHTFYMRNTSSANSSIVEA